MAAGRTIARKGRISLRERVNEHVMVLPNACLRRKSGQTKRRGQGRFVLTDGRARVSLCERVWVYTYTRVRGYAVTPRARVVVHTRMSESVRVNKRASACGKARRARERESERTRESEGALVSESAR
eukprot:5745659-Pleurochrysis_carterae.AAC.3